MQQNAKFIRKLPIPMDIKNEFPVTEEVAKVREARVKRCARSSTGVTAA